MNFKNFRRKIRRANITTRLVLSFSAILLLFLVVAFYTNHAIHRADSYHRANIEYILARRELVYMTTGEFYRFRFQLRGSYLSNSWHILGGQPERWHYARLLSEAHNNMQDFAKRHIQLAYDDPFVRYDLLSLEIQYMNVVSEYLYRVHKQLATHFFPGSDLSEFAGNIEGYMDYVGELLEFLLTVVAHSAESALYETDMILSNTMNFTIALVLTTFALVSVLAYMMITTFTDSVKVVESRVRKIKRGDINAVLTGKASNEISRLVTDVVGVFQDRERESFKRTQLMFDSTPLLIEYWNRDYECIDCNQTTLSYFGITDKDEFLDDYARIVEFSHDTAKARWVDWDKHLETAFATGECNFESVTYSESGIPVYFRCSAQRLEKDGEHVVVTYAQDITADKNIEKERQRSAAAEENSLAKTRFLARMSHEIRTPLTAVLGISEIQLQNPSISLQVEEAFAKIHNSATMLLSLVNDILDLSRIESGKLETLDGPYEVASLITDVVQMHMIYLGSKKIEFKINADPNMPSYLVGDELRIRQVLNNLLSNAFKYTESGMVEFSLERKNHENNNMINLQISIRDTGHGMEPEHLKDLTNEYTRYHEREFRTVDGTGLGMPIVYNLLQLMGGKMNIKSEVGVGTHVTVNLPQAISNSETIGTETAENLKTVDYMSRSLVKKVKLVPEPMPYGKVLVVDDIDTNLYVARGLLMFYDLQIETCLSGAEAISRVREGQSYDIIFMDQMMPEMTGIEATQILRNEMGYSKPVVALTANALIGQADIFMQSGFDGFLSKPIQTVHLNGVLNKFIRDKQPPEVIEAVRAQKPKGGSSGINSFLERELSKLRRDFRSGQKNTVKNIRGALATGNFETAHRLAHTRKGLAGLIKEEDLAKASVAVEQLLLKKINPSEEINILERRLTRILSDIEEAISREAPTKVKELAFTKDEQKALFKELMTRLNESDATCLEMLNDLAQIPETKVLIKQIEEFNFDAALVTMAALCDILDL